MITGTPESRKARHDCFLRLPGFVTVSSILAAIAVSFSACRPVDPVNRPVMLLAAASTTDAVKEIADRFEESRGTRVTISIGSSSGLARQILAGAPANIFLSANEKWSAVVQQQADVARSKPLLTNQLVLIVPRGNPAGVMGPADLTSDRVRRVALAGDQVPAGIYADQALDSLGLRDELSEAQKIVRGQDVRATLSYVVRGEAEAGIVYATDAGLSEQVDTVWTFAQESHAPIVYPCLLMRRDMEHEAAEGFYAFLFSAEASEVFRRYGFGPVSSEPSEEASRG